MEPSTFDTHNCDASRVTTFFSPTGTVTVPDTQALSGGQRRANVQTFPPMPPDGLPRPGSALARLILRCRRHPPGIPCPAVRCESDADCPHLLGDPCVQCVGGLCMSNHPCV